MNILFLCNKPKVGNDANTIVDHIEAFEQYSQHKIWICSNLGDIPLKLGLEKFDVIIIHYSLCLLHDYFLTAKAKQRIREYKGLKVVFIQDEYRQVNRIIDAFAYMELDAIFTCFPEEEMERIYPQSKLPGTAKYNNLTGYVPERLTQIRGQTPIADRPLHVGYRGRKVQFWLGELAYEKWSIVEKWQEYTQQSNLKSDLSYREHDRIYGANWIQFVSSCKASLGVESGASVIDFTGDLEKNIDYYQMTHPNESFESVQKKFLLSHEGKYKLNQISPRCFEAIALKTVLVLYEGEYSGILEPGRHFIPLKKDFSNISEVVSKLHDNEYLQNMADVAYEEIALNHKYSYQTFIQNFDDIINNEFTARAKKRVAAPYNQSDYDKALQSISLKSKFYKNRLTIFQKLPPSLRLVVKGIFRPKTTLKLFAKQLCMLLNKKKNS